MDPALRLASLFEAHDQSMFGGKAARLGVAVRAGLPVPPGAVLDVSLVEEVARHDRHAVDALVSSAIVPASALVVRSSAVGEDSLQASFAGRYATCLNVSRAGLVEAVGTIWRSARSPAVAAYRARHGMTGEPRIAVVVQQMLEPVAAGVVFTCHPVTGVDEILIEAAWGLGEAVVNGRVVPDRFRLDRDGRVLEQTLGHKDLKICGKRGGGTVEEPVLPELREVFCLSDRQLRALHGLVERCCTVWGGRRLDLEWALGPDGQIHLLQCRPITTTVRWRT